MGACFFALVNFTLINSAVLAVDCSNCTASPAVEIMILSLSSRNGNRGTRGLPLKHRNLMKYSRHQLRSTVKHDAVFEGNRHDVAEVVKQFGMRADLFVRASPNLKPISIFHSLFTNGTSLDFPLAIPSRTAHSKLQKHLLKISPGGKESHPTQCSRTLCPPFVSAKVLAQIVGEIECFFVHLHRINGNTRS